MKHDIKVEWLVLKQIKEAGSGIFFYKEEVTKKTKSKSVVSTAPYLNVKNAYVSELDSQTVGEDEISYYIKTAEGSNEYYTHIIKQSPASENQTDFEENDKPNAIEL